MLTNECWLGYHDQCELHENCDCLCHETFDWPDAFEDGPTLAAIWEETEQAVKRWLDEDAEKI